MEFADTSAGDEEEDSGAAKRTRVDDEVAAADADDAVTATVIGKFEEKVFFRSERDKII